MPWVEADAARKTKKAKSPAAKKQWKTVANKVLGETGNEASAIRIANSAVKKRKKTSKAPNLVVVK